MEENTNMGRSKGQGDIQRGPDGRIPQTPKESNIIIMTETGIVTTLEIQRATPKNGTSIHHTSAKDRRLNIAPPAPVLQ